MSINPNDLDRIFKNNCTEIYNIFHEDKFIKQFQGEIKGVLKACKISANVTGRYLPEYQILILDQKVRDSGWIEVVPEWFQSNLGRDIRTVHVVELGAAARLCVQQADEFFKEIFASALFNPTATHAAVNSGNHPYRSLPQGSKLL